MASRVGLGVCSAPTARRFPDDRIPIQRRGRVRLRARVRIRKRLTGYFNRQYALGPNEDILLNATTTSHPTAFGQCTSLGESSTGVSLTVHPCDRQLKHGRYRHPDKVGDLSEAHPPIMTPYCAHQPEDRRPDDQNIQRGQRQVSHASQYRHKEHVCHEINGERRSHPPGELLAKRLKENEAERHEDYRIKDIPDQPDGGWGWRPSRLY